MERLGFKGGKGVATALGVLVALPVSAAVGFVACALVVAVTRVSRRDISSPRSAAEAIMLRAAGLLVLTGLAASNCKPATDSRLHLVIDTDANNELDDQHALAWATLSGAHFVIEGVTLNATRSGGDVAAQRAEAYRVLSLVGLEQAIPLRSGANGNFDQIRPTLGTGGFDGAEAVEFLLDRARQRPLTVVALGKLTNLALAIAAAPELAGQLRVVWLGSNYPGPGEYNLENDPAAVGFLLDSGVALEIVTVRYGDVTGTDAVRITPEEISRRMPGLGPRATIPVEGRYGGTFSTFGDYSVDLFGHAVFNGQPPSRALFDLAAVNIVAHPDHGRRRTMPAPVLDGVSWMERPENPRSIGLWELFDRDAIVEDLFRTLKAPVAAVP